MSSQDLSISGTSSATSSQNNPQSAGGAGAGSSGGGGGGAAYGDWNWKPISLVPSQVSTQEFAAAFAAQQIFQNVKNGGG